MRDWSAAELASNPASVLLASLNGSAMVKDL